MVCRADRAFDDIAVAYRAYAGHEDLFPDVMKVNVRYCTDNPACVAVATAEGPWPSQPGPEGTNA